MDAWNIFPWQIPIELYLNILVGSVEVISKQTEPIASWISLWVLSYLLLVFLSSPCSLFLLCSLEELLIMIFISFLRWLQNTWIFLRKGLLGWNETFSVTVLFDGHLWICEKWQVETMITEDFCKQDPMSELTFIWWLFMKAS